ncbi:TIGR04283 family arsenosugar biosynthesis glycosyltransferase [Candidatus Poribacteria bacterium]|nr:TIGR04283 family arsenosugar biosynthesis glycosyltransferase [Candidatus Poribacteria bacterium]
MSSRTRDESESSFSERLIIFTRYPAPGNTKTRLIPAVGAQGAADLHRRMTEHALSRLKRLKPHRRVSIEISYDGGSEQLMKEWLGPGVIFRPQIGSGLGERMAGAFSEAFAEGAEKVVLVGTDCPGLNVSIAEEAFRALRHSDVVLGPASDGGYYLIGLKRVTPQLFDGISWGATEVLEQTLKTANDLGLSTAFVSKLDDVDRVEDLHVWEKEESGTATASLARRISVIIPALNEEALIANTLASLRDEPSIETIVVDAGSSDGTVSLASSYGAQIVQSSQGRGRQMNAGAAEATGDILIFLHADTSLPKGFSRMVRDALSQSGTVAGAFELRIDSIRSSLRVVEKMVNWRSRRLGMPYGDQAIFMWADTFHSMGGFPEIPIMEDFEFVRRLRQRGKIEIITAPALTSARRWIALGLWRTTLINQATIAAYYMGVSLPRIAHWQQRGTLYRKNGNVI